MECPLQVLTFFFHQSGRSDCWRHFLQDADLAILEGMYGSEEKDTHAKVKLHMTFAEAADLAKKANVKKLWLTHFSPSMPSPEMYLQEATSVFENAEIGFDGKTETVRFKD